MVTITIMLVFEIILLCFSYYVTCRDILAPSVLTLLVFVGSTICIIYNHEYWDVDYEPRTMMIVLTGLTTAVLADLCARLLQKHRRIRIEESDVRPIYPKKILNIVVLCILTFCVLIFIAQIFSLGASLGTVNLSTIGKVKGSTEVAVGGFPLLCYDVVLMSTFVYLYIFINNVIVCKEKNKKNLLYLYAICLGVVSVIFRGQRYPLMQFVIAGTVDLVILQRWKKGFKAIRTWTFIRKAMPVLVIFAVIFYMLREIVKGTTISRTFMDYVTFYFGSSLYLFDKYLKQPNSVYLMTDYLGGTTFGNFYGFLYSCGLVDKRVGTLGFLRIGGNTLSHGNEYTMFMRPYHDFGYWGMLLFVFLFYFIMGRAYYKTMFSRNHIKSKFGLMVLSYFYYLVFMSFYFAGTTLEIRPQTLGMLLFMYLMYLVLVKVKITFKRK